MISLQNHSINGNGADVEAGDGVDTGSDITNTDTGSNTTNTDTGSNAAYVK